MTTEVVTRRAGSADLDALLHDIAAGFASYVEFAPAGWRPPDPERHRDWEAEVLADPPGPRVFGQAPGSQPSR